MNLTSRNKMSAKEDVVMFVVRLSHAWFLGLIFCDTNKSEMKETPKERNTKIGNASWTGDIAPCCVMSNSLSWAQQLLLWFWQSSAATGSCCLWSSRSHAQRLTCCTRATTGGTSSKRMAMRPACSGHGRWAFTPVCIAQIVTMDSQSYSKGPGNKQCAGCVSRNQDRCGQFYLLSYNDDTLGRLPKKWLLVATNCEKGHKITSSSLWLARLLVLCNYSNMRPTWAWEVFRRASWRSSRSLLFTQCIALIPIAPCNFRRINKDHCSHWWVVHGFKLLLYWRIMKSSHDLVYHGKLLFLSQV